MLKNANLLDRKQFFSVRNLEFEQICGEVEILDN